MVTAYNMKLKETPFFDNLLIEESTPPVNPLSADLATIDRIKSSSVSVSMLEMWLKRKFESTVMASTSQLVWKVYLKQEAFA